MRYKRIPFLTREEYQNILDRTERMPDGCLLFENFESDMNGLVRIRDMMLKVTRIVWAETYGFTANAIEQLDTHEVIHIPECPHTGDESRTKRLCIEPTHLMLGDTKVQHQMAKERKNG